MILYRVSRYQVAKKTKLSWNILVNIYAINDKKNKVLKRGFYSLYNNLCKATILILSLWNKMNQQEVDQIKNIIINIEEKKWSIPYFSDLENHEVFGPIFKSINSDDKIEIQHIINDYIADKIESMTKTKWGQLFKRFFEAYNELFWKFRTMNETGESKDFQETGRQVEQEMFKLEGILTERMLKQEKWLDKVIDSFYKIVYTFFPKYNQID